MRVKVLNFIIVLISLLFLSCNNQDTSTYNKPQTYEFRTTICGACGGSGVILNPYDYNYYYCQQCKGRGTISSYQPSFTGMTSCHKCDCKGFTGSKTGPCQTIISISGKKCNHDYEDHGI